jgi:hypothetical protein
MKQAQRRTGGRWDSFGACGVRGWFVSSFGPQVVKNNHPTILHIRPCGGTYLHKVCATFPPQQMVSTNQMPVSCSEFRGERLHSLITVRYGPPRFPRSDDPSVRTNAKTACRICSGSFGQRSRISANSGSTGVSGAFRVPLSARLASEIGVFVPVSGVCSTPLGARSSISAGAGVDADPAAGGRRLSDLLYRSSTPTGFGSRTVAGLRASDLASSEPIRVVEITRGTRWQRAHST